MSESSVESFLSFSDKYNPKSFLDCDHSKKTSNMLDTISKNKENVLPNIALYGPSGCGKYTRLMITLHNFFLNKSSPYKTSIRAICSETGSFVPLPTSKNKPKDKVIFAMVSKIHCEIELNQANAEKVLILFLEYYSKTKNIYLNTHKYIILRNVEYLKKETQNALRRIVELYHNKIRFLITINSISKLIKPLRSRFLCISVISPNENEALNIIHKIACKENFKITKHKSNEIIEKSKYGTCGSINLHELLLTLEGSIIISNNKINKIYTSERNEASDLLIKAVIKGNIDEIRNIIFKIYEVMKDEFKHIVCCDFYRKMLNHIKDINKFEFIKISTEWNSIIYKNNILEPILQAEAYMYSVCKLYHV